MATITAGSGGTITATTLEAFFVTAIRRLQTLEKSSTYNPSSINNVTSSISDDSSSFNASVTFPLNLTTDGDGESPFVCVDYLVGASGQYSTGSGGTITAPNLVRAIFEATLRLSNLEIQPVKNPQNLNCLSWTITKSDIGSANHATFSLTVSNFPLEIVDGGDSQTTKGKEYLLN